jgi:hypothetical protein
MSTDPNGETHAEREERLRGLRYPDDGLDAGYSAPAVEPLASRLERARRVEVCRRQTEEMLVNLVDRGGWGAVSNVWVKGVCVPFVVFGWRGVFLVWAVDERWTPRQAALVMRAREQIQRELGDAFTGQVEAVFHSPREGTGWHRWVLTDEESGQPFDIVAMGGRIDELLTDWTPAGGVGIDPEWVSWLDQASLPRWWRSGEGMSKPPEPPPHEKLR